MTYNFDPDKWYQNELAALRLKHRTGQTNQLEFESAVEKLEQRYEGMLERLDGTYQLPKSEDPVH